MLDTKTHAAGALSGQQSTASEDLCSPPPEQQSPGLVESRAADDGQAYEAAPAQAQVPSSEQQMASAVPQIAVHQEPGVAAADTGEAQPASSTQQSPDLAAAPAVPCATETGSGSSAHKLIQGVRAQ